MKQYIYPAVFYYDKEFNDYAVEFSDICIYAEGDTMEEAYENAQDYLYAYLETCDELGISPTPPNTYTDILKSHPNGKVLLVTADYESKKKSNSNEVPMTEKQFAKIEDDIVEEIEDGFKDGDNAILKEILKNRAQSKHNKKDDDGDDGDFSLPEID